MVTWVATNPWENREKKTVNFWILGTSKMDQNGVCLFFFGGGILEDDVPMISNVLIAPENGWDNDSTW